MFNATLTVIVGGFSIYNLYTEDISENPKANLYCSRIVICCKIIDHRQFIGLYIVFGTKENDTTNHQ